MRLKTPKIIYFHICAVKNIPNVSLPYGEVINMMASVLQILFQLSAASGLAFMVLCTVSVIISFVRGGIKISMARDEADETDN